MATVAVVGALLTAGNASAGNIFLTGHDTDYHYYYGSSSAASALMADIAFVTNGSKLPVLTFDSGVELTSDLTKLGVTYTNVDPNGALTASLFDATKYSAIIVASDSSCGGCDNSDAGLANLAAQSTAIASFFNAGGGILGLSGANDLNAYAYVPQAAASIGGYPPASGFVETAAGTALGLLAENGDPTHNYFGMPGTGGLSAAYVVAEINGGNNESLALKNGAITCVGEACTIGGGGGTDVPEPATFALFGLGLLGLGMVRATNQRA